MKSDFQHRQQVPWQSRIASTGFSPHPSGAAAVFAALAFALLLAHAPQQAGARLVLVPMEKQPLARLF